MLYKKTSTLLLCFIFTFQILAQNAPKTAVKKSVVAPKVQEKAVALLNNLAREAEQFSLPSNRVASRIEIGKLLWEPDEKQARAIFQSAILELNTIINQIPPIYSEDGEENPGRYSILSSAETLRKDLLTALGSRDPKLALESFQTLSRKDKFGNNIFGEDQTLELNLAARVAERDPKQAYQMAKKNLENGIGENLFSTLESLYEKDAELGVKLAQDIAAKIKSKDTNIGSNSDYTSNTMSAGMMMANTGSANVSVNGGFTSGSTANTGNSNVSVISNQTGIITMNTWDVQSFLEIIKKLNRQAAKDKKTAALSENEIKEIIDILAQKFVRRQNLSAYEVVNIMPEITRYFPAQAQAIHHKIGQLQSAMLNFQIDAESFQNETEDKSAAEITQIIEKKPAAERDNLYYKAAEIAYANGEIEEAKKFYGKIKTRRENDYLDKNIENALPLALAGKGDLREVRRMLAKLKTPEERIEILTTLAANVAVKGDAKSAAALMAEARSAYSGRMKNRKNLASVLQIAQAYAAFDAEQGFAFLESNVSFFNDLIGAGILLDEFNEDGAVENEEVRLDRVRDESYRNLPKGVALIKSLSAADFDRTVAFAEKFSRPEVRFYARLRVAEALLNPDAEADEKELQTSLEDESEAPE